jgi:para-nitrobenzyl esterase
MPAKTVSAITLAAIAAVSSAIAGGTHDYKHEPRTDVVHTKEGPVRGFKIKDVDIFLGIPFAAPPVGNLRWQPPQPVAPWRRTLDTTEFGNRCVQTNTFGVFAAVSDKEDCLYLNVFAPSSKGHDNDDDDDHGHKHKLKPVMVWIYGGGLFDGSTNEYDGSKLARDGDVVFVSMNYRLNIMGFISHPALDTESDANTNYGIMDMQAALRWVQRNIRQFGGDPDNVTIFGESAGGTAVYFNMISPAAKGLFHRAIAHSPAYAATQATYAAGVVRGQEFAAAVGCGSDASAATAACLRAVPIQKIIDSGFPGRGPVRALDGKILTINMGEAFATGNFNKVPVISGNNRDEQTWFLGMTELNSGTVLTAANYPAAVNTAFGAVVGPQVLTQYPLSNYPNPSNALAAAQTDRGFACGTRRANRLLAQHVPTYGYLFADRTAPFYFPPVSFNYWAAHTLELEYIFANFKGATGVFKPLNRAQSKLSDDMVSYWTTFARTGNPNSRKTPDWDRYTLDKDNYQLLDLPKPRGTLQFSTIHKCDFWTSIDGP